MKLVYLEEARRELLDSVAYYDACAAGLGHHFYAEVQAGENAILQMPDAWGPVAGGSVDGTWNPAPTTALSDQEAKGVDLC